MSGLIRLEPAHAEIAAALHATSFDTPWGTDDFARLLEQPGTAGLAWTNPAPLGFILIRAVADEAEILTIAVMPEARRKGIATTLLDEAAAMLRSGGTHRLFLEVAADNTAALDLYVAHGFKPSGRRKGYYARGAARVDAILMTLMLTAPASPTPHH